jgi:hypothetical protein
LSLFGWLFSVRRDPVTTHPDTGEWYGHWGRYEMWAVGLALLFVVFLWYRFRRRSSR